MIPPPLAVAAVRAVLIESFGERLEIDLFRGFLVAVGGAFLDGINELVNDPLSPGSRLVAEFSGWPPESVPVQLPVMRTSLDDALLIALDTAAQELREGASPVVTGTLLEVVAAASNGVVIERDQPVPVAALRAEPESLLWRTTCEIGNREEPPSNGELSILRAALVDADWRARVAALIAAGRFRLAELEERVRSVPLPAAGSDISDSERRALMAARDIAAAHAAGISFDRPHHPDPSIAAARSALITDVDALITRRELPSRDSSAYVLAAIVDPAAVRADSRVPAHWRSWL